MAARDVFTLLDVQTNNACGAYPTEAAALRDVARTIELYGEYSPEVQELMLVGPAGYTAEGAELAQRALRRFPTRKSA